MNRLALTPVVKQILIGCVILFAGTYLLNAKGTINLQMVLSMFYPNSPFFKPWQIITHMFMHGSLGHIIFNMFALVSIGTIIERFLGPKKFLQLYFFSGLGAILIHFLSQVVQIHHLTGLWFPDFNQLGLIVDGYSIKTSGLLLTTQEQFDAVTDIVATPVLGASGAIYGVVAAFAFLFPNTELMIMFIPYPIKAKYLVPGFILLDIILGFSSVSGDNIAHFAHIGGALFGLALVFFWRKFDKRNFY
jgi:membrane associated rhomboid family serine protease